MKPKPKREKAAKRKRSVRDISTDGQVELRGSEIILHEPLKSEIGQICKARNITMQELWDNYAIPALRTEGEAARTSELQARQKKRAGKRP